MDPTPTRPDIPPRDNVPSPAEWFAQADPRGTDPLPAPPKRSKRWLIVTGIVLVATACLLVIIYVFFAPRSASCFDADNYTELLDIIKPIASDTIGTEDVQPQEPLYTHAIYFQSGTTDFDTDHMEDPTDFLQSIGSYSSKRHTATPITVTLTTGYSAADTIDIAQARIDYVRNILVRAGMTASAVITPQPALVEPDAESDNDDVADGSLPLLVSVTPVSSCHIKD